MPKSYIIIITRVGFLRNCYLPELCAIITLDVALKVRAAAAKIKLLFLQQVVSSFRPACLTLLHLVHKKYLFILKSACLTQMVLSCHHPVTEWNVNPVLRRGNGTLLKLNASQQTGQFFGRVRSWAKILSVPIYAMFFGHPSSWQCLCFLTEATK